MPEIELTVTIDGAEPSHETEATAAFICERALMKYEPFEGCEVVAEVVQED